MFFLFFAYKNNKKKEYMALFLHFYFVLLSIFSQNVMISDKNSLSLYPPIIGVDQATVSC